jgi:hypothetical protein
MGYPYPFCGLCQIKMRIADDEWYDESLEKE